MRTRRLGAWGFEGERYEPSPALVEWLAERLGPTAPFPRCDPDAAELPPARLEWLADRLGPTEPFPRGDPAGAELPAPRHSRTTETWPSRST